MTIASWLLGLTRGSLATLKKARASAPRKRSYRSWQSAECLEVRTLLSAFAPGFALGIGSTKIDSAMDVATDHSGNVFVAGYSGSPSIDLDPGPETYSLTNAGVYNGFAAKYDPAGNLLWGVQESGTGNDKVTKVAVDGTGNALIFGTFGGSIDIGAAAAGLAHVMLTNSGNNEWFLAKIDPAGNALWATSIGATATRWVSDITADVAGNVYATGYEGNRLFVAKFGADGASAWTQVVSGVTGKPYKVSGSDVAVDVNSNVYVVGTYQGMIDFNPDLIKTNTLTSAGNDAFVLKLNADGAYVRAGGMGGRGDDNASGIALDSTGNVHVIGGFTADSKADLDPGSGRLNLPNGGGFVVKLDPNLNAIWGRNTVGSSKITVDAAGNVYTTGLFSGTIDSDAGPGKFNLTAGGEYDAFISQLNSAGNFVWAGALGGPGSGRTASNGITVDGSGNILTVGYFAGTADFDPGLATYSLTATPDGIANRSMDAFVSKLVPSSSLPAASPACSVSGQSASSSPITPFTAESSYGLGFALGIGSTGTENAHAVVTDAAGNMVVAGNFTSPSLDLDPGPGAYFLPEALARSRATGVSTAAPGNRQVRITKLHGMQLDLASGDTFTLDENAAGRELFVDPMPGDNSK